MEPRFRLRRTKQFEKDYRKRIERFPKIRDDLEQVVDLLRGGSALPTQYRDHPLKGRLQGLRDCHVRGDVVLVYFVEEETCLVLVRVGTHAQLGL